MDDRSLASLANWLESISRTDTGLIEQYNNLLIRGICSQSNKASERIHWGWFKSESDQTSEFIKLYNFYIQLNMIVIDNDICVDSQCLFYHHLPHRFKNTCSYAKFTKERNFLFSTDFLFKESFRRHDLPILPGARIFNYIPISPQLISDASRQLTV